VFYQVGNWLKEAFQEFEEEVACLFMTSDFKLLQLLRLFVFRLVKHWYRACN